MIAKVQPLSFLVVQFTISLKKAPEHRYDGIFRFQKLFHCQMYSPKGSTCTSTGLLFTVSVWFDTMHLYVPLSFISAWPIVSSISIPSCINWLSLYHWYCGFGKPLALHLNIMLPPARTGCDLGCSVISTSSTIINIFI